MRQVIVHAQRKNRPADQPSHQENPCVAEAIAAGVSVLHHLSGNHAEGKPREGQSDMVESVKASGEPLALALYGSASAAGQVGFGGCVNLLMGQSLTRAPHENDLFD